MVYRMIHLHNEIKTMANMTLIAMVVMVMVMVIVIVKVLQYPNFWFCGELKEVHQLIFDSGKTWLT